MKWFQPSKVGNYYKPSNITTFVYALIQRELTELVHMWNTQLIRRRRDVINGIPNELFCLPDMRGLNSTFLWFYLSNRYTGYEDCSTTYSDLEMEFTMQYMKEKPFLTVQFLALTNILIEENLQRPTTPILFGPCSSY